MFYAPEDKIIYTSPTNHRYDPLALKRKLVLASNGNFNSWLLQWTDDQTPEVNRAQAENAIVEAARAGFGLGSFEQDQGYTDAVVLAVVEDFLEWLQGKELRGQKRPE